MNLDYALVKVGGKKILNHSKIKNDDAYEIVKNNTLVIISESEASEHGDKCMLPKNFDVLKGLLSQKNVYAVPGNNFNHFSGKNFIGEFPLSVIKSKDIFGITKDVSKFLERGLAVYIHSYYIMNVDRYIDDELTVNEPWFWYRIGLKKVD